MLNSGDYLYVDPACSDCFSYSNPGCFNTGTFRHTIWDAGYNSFTMVSWDVSNKSKAPCQVTICADCPFSDERLKTGIRTITTALNDLLSMNVTEYDWNENYSNYDYLKERQKLHSIGMIAQDIQKIYPEVVYRRDDGYLAIKYFKLNGLIIEAIKEHQVFIEDITEEINWLKTQIN